MMFDYMLHSGAGVTSDEWRDMLVLAVHLVSAVGWLTFLALLAILSGIIVRTQDKSLRDTVRVVRYRTLGPLWLFIGLLVVTGIYNQYRNVPWPLPPPWEAMDSTVQYMRSYTLLLFGKHLFIASMLIGLVVVTWRLVVREASVSATARGTTALRPVRGGATDDDDGPQWMENPENTMERGITWVSVFSLLTGVGVLAVTAVLGYVHLLAHGHGT
jgi:hypothetical protein